MSWTSYSPVRFAGVAYGQKDVEFARFAELPGRVADVQFEVALGGTKHVHWQADGRAGEPGDVLRRLGWRVVDPNRACAGLDRYRRFVESSRAEWSVAKNGYVVGQPGWFSCRSACYLASGRPVVVQDTGFSDVLPVGEGILAFTTLRKPSKESRRSSRTTRATRTLRESSPTSSSPPIECWVDS